MGRERWLEIIVGIAAVTLLSFLGWVGYQIYDMRGTVSAHDGKLDNVSRRVDRIVEVLPDVRARIANEELHKVIKGAIVTTKPIKNSLGEWISFVHLIDYKKNKRKIFLISAKDDNVNELKLFIIRRAYQIDCNAIPFSKYEDWSYEAEIPSTVAGYIDKNASFVLNKEIVNYEKALNKLEKEVKVKKLNTCVLLHTSLIWLKLAKDLRENPKIYNASMGECR